MKNDIKKLYKKDPKLAKKVAKVLGYKIVAKLDANEIADYGYKAMDAIMKFSSVFYQYAQGIKDKKLMKTGKDFLKETKNYHGKINKLMETVGQ